MANNLKIYSNDGRETSYDIYVDGVFKVNVPITPTTSGYEVSVNNLDLEIYGYDKASQEKIKTS